MKKLKERKLNTQVHKWYWENFEKLTGFENNRLVDHTRKHKLKPEITHKMKKVINSIKKVTVHLNILGLLFIVACGSDNPVNNNSINPLPVFTIDSFSVWSNSLGDTTENLTKTFSADLDSFNISFEVSCNSANSLTFLNVSFIDTGSSLMASTLSETELNKTHSVNLYSINGNCSKTVNMSIHLNNGNLNFPKYLRIKNFKVVKLN